MPAVKRLWADPVALATGLAASLPVMVSAVRGLSAGWIPEGDRAVIATRAYDVLSSMTPLVGPWSSTSQEIGEPTFHAGPLLYWLLAVPAHLSADWTLLLTMAAINVAAIVYAVMLARRRGGTALMFVTAAALVIMCASLEPEALRDIWNPTAPLVAFSLLFLLCWSLCCGEYRLLPLAILAASFAMQSHFVFLLPCAAMLAVGLIGMTASRIEHGRDRGDQPAARPGEARSFRLWITAGAVVLVLCWSGPLIDQGLGWTGSDRGSGNLVNIFEAADARDEPAGAKAGGYAVVRAIGVPPWWLRPPPEAANRVFEIFGRPAIPAFVSSVLLLAILAITTVLGVRRRRWDVAGGGALALVSCAALAAVTASFPNTPEQIFSYSYSSWWAAPVGMWTWLVAGWSAVALWSSSARSARVRLPRVPALVPVAAVLVLSILVAATQGSDPKQQVYDATHEIAERLDAELPEPGSVRVAGSSLEFETAVIDTLRRRGATIGTGEVAVQFGRDYAPSGRVFEDLVDVRAGNAPPAGVRAIARVSITRPAPSVTVVSLRRGR